MLLAPPHPLAADAPLFGLVLRTPRLVLRPVWDDDLSSMVDASMAGMHPDDEMPFAFPWSRAARPELFAGTAATVWTERAEKRSPANWQVSFAVREANGDGEWWKAPVIGRQDLFARDFSLLRTIESGSWLTLAAQGRGLGQEMRAALLLFAFDHLGANTATSGAYAWNKKSLGVSRAMGYETNGERLVVIEDRAETEVLLKLEREAFRRPIWDLEVHGAADARGALGITVPTR